MVGASCKRDWRGRLATALAVTVALGALTGAAPPPGGSDTDFARACAARGGAVGRGGIMGGPVCRIPYADAGKPCTDKRQCLGQCIYRGAAGRGQPRPGSPASGRCQASTPIFGCHAIIVEGRVDHVLCTD